VPLVVASGTLLGMVPFRPGRVTTIAKILLVQGHRRVGDSTASDSGPRRAESDSGPHPIRSDRQ
jgi:hypothetical protein